MFAVVNLHTATVKTLLSFGADVNVQAADGCTPLILAACSGDVAIAQALLNNGADVKPTLMPGMTALVLALDHGYNGIVELLKRALVQSTEPKPQESSTDFGS
jgi:ankyrin repeat protein